MDPQSPYAGAYTPAPTPAPAPQPIAPGPFVAPQLPPGYMPQVPPPATPPAAWPNPYQAPPPPAGAYVPQPQQPQYPVPQPAQFAPPPAQPQFGPHPIPQPYGAPLPQAAPQLAPSPLPYFAPQAAPQPQAPPQPVPVPPLPQPVASPPGFAPAAPVPQSADEITRLRQVEAQHLQLQSQLASHAQATEAARLQALAERGQVQEAFAAFQRQADARYQQLRAQNESEARSRAVADALSAVAWVDDTRRQQARQLLEAQLETAFDEVQQRPVVRLKGTGLPANEGLVQMVRSPEFAHFRAPTHTGGTMGATYQGFPQPPAPQPGQLPINQQPPDLAIINQFRESQGLPPVNASLPVNQFGLSAGLGMSGLAPLSGVNRPPAPIYQPPGYLPPNG